MSGEPQGHSCAGGSSCETRYFKTKKTVSLSLSLSLLDGTWEPGVNFECLSPLLSTLFYFV